MRTELASKLSVPNFRLGRLTASGWIALAIVAAVVLFAVVGPFLIPSGPNAQTVAVDKSPSLAHPFGLDGQGRDILARLAQGARWSLVIGLGATMIALVAGAIVGSVAATARKSVDEVIMRLLDIVMAFPGIAIAAVLVAVFGRALPVLVAAIGFLYTPMVVRIVRANVQAQYSEDYVAASKISGARTHYLVSRHIAVNVAAPVLVFCTVLVADAIVFEASLSFIGAGVQQPFASWGSVIAEGKDQLLLGGWWATTFPGLLIFATVVALNVLSEGFSDTLAAPSARSLKAVQKANVAERKRVERQPHDVSPIPGLAEAARRIRARVRNFDDAETVLDIGDLSVRFPDRHEGVNVVDGISFNVRRGEVLALIGESGCGKSLTSLSIMGLEPRGAVVSGEVRLEGVDLLKVSGRERRRHMGRGMSMIYQDALSSLNPAMTINQQLRQFTRRGGTRTPEELLELVMLDPARTLKAYPHELSGGQRQRVLIALALSRDPKVVIADEPTTALDVTVQAEVMKLILRLQAELGFALVLVSHDLALVSDIADRVLVMYGGRIAEAGQIDQVVAEPAHHYTRGLLSAVISLESGAGRLTQIEGTVPAPANFPTGCRFADRCPMATDRCLVAQPALTARSESHDNHHSHQHRHVFACHFPAPETTVDRKAMVS